MDIKKIIHALLSVNSDEIQEIERANWLSNVLLRGFLVINSTVGMAVMGRCAFISYLESSLQFPFEIS